MAALALRPRAHFLDRLGLAAGEGAAAARLYVVPQNLQKLHPEFDAALGGILARDPAARVVLLFDGKKRRHSLRGRVEARLARSLGAARAARVRWLPRMRNVVFLSLLAAADVVLDPFPFGGGITTLDALRVGDIGCHHTDVSGEGNNVVF